MSDQVQISSIAALEEFRAELIRYISKIGTALEDVVGDVRRTQAWLDFDRIQYWESQVRGWSKKLDQAEQELYSANLTNPKASNAFQKMAVLKATRALADAEQKVKVVKQWRNSFEARSTPLLRQLDPMFHIVGQQLPKGVHALGESIKALQAYAEKSPIPSTPPPSTGAEGGAA